MIGPPLLLAAMVALGLVVWAVFYMLGSPLNPAEAVVVVGLCGAIAYGVRAAILHFLHGRKKASGPHEEHGTTRHAPTRVRAKSKAGSKARKKRH
jgi:hypothetical protein